LDNGDYSKKTEKELEFSIKEILLSLGNQAPEDCYIDKKGRSVCKPTGDKNIIWNLEPENTLDCQHGHKVFIHEWHAAHHLDKIDSSDVSSTDYAAIQEVIDSLTGDENPMHQIQQYKVAWKKTCSL
jgi:hypothetical protein